MVPAVQKLSPGLLVALAFFSSVAPFGIDMYLPAMPTITEELGTTPAIAQLTISGFMLGMALGNLVFGAISDSTGRKSPIVAASAVFLAASVACALAPGIWPLIAARFIQGLAAGCLEAVSRAVVPDVSHGKQAARAFSGLMALTGFVPAIAPIIGGTMLPVVGWRGVFWLLVALNVVQAILAFRMSETLPEEKRSAGVLRSMFPRMWLCLRRPAFVGYMLAGSLGFGALFAYIAASPLVLQSQLGLGSTAYGLIFGGMALLIPVSNTLNMRALRAKHPRSLLVGALLIDACIALILLPFALTTPTLWALPFFAVLSLMGGFIMANASALAVEEVRDIGTGAGSGALGFCQFIIAAAMPPLVALGANHMLSMALGTLGCAVLAAAAVLGLTKQRELK
ncbi:MFS transporter permease [Corynebacterium sp. HMSC074A01]|nr:MFS transporter permease [Corynebacterium sp. HMSC074A01]